MAAFQIAVVPNSIQSKAPFFSSPSSRTIHHSTVRFPSPRNPNRSIGFGSDCRRLLPRRRISAVQGKASTSTSSSSSSSSDYYATLNVKRSASLQEFKAAYRNLARKLCWSCLQNEIKVTWKEDEGEQSLCCFLKGFLKGVLHVNGWGSEFEKWQNSFFLEILMDLMFAVPKSGK